MQITSKKTAFTLALVGLPLLFFPKFNLLQFNGETAGIRIDDLLLLTICTFILWSQFIIKPQLNKIELWVFILLASSLASFTANHFLIYLDILPPHLSSKFFYSVRIYEYFMYFYLGIFASHFFSSYKIIYAFFLWNLLLMSLQKIGITGGIIAGHYVSSTTYRVSGIASFPSEMGALLNLMFCFLLFQDEIISKYIQPTNTFFFRRFFVKIKPYLYFFIFSIFILFTGSRTSIIALLIPFIYKIKNDFCLKSLNSLITSLLILAVVISSTTYFLTKTNSIFYRSLNLISTENLYLIKHTWSEIILSSSPLEVNSIEYGSYDMSWWIRIQKWCYALKNYIHYPECYLQGIGPGFAMPALDGGLLRILTEHGIIGCIVFFQLFRTIYKISLQLKWMVISFMINMIFFDAYLAYKPMSLLFLVTGLSWDPKKSFDSYSCITKLAGNQIKSI